jgi:hypothetical protein
MTVREGMLPSAMVPGLVTIEDKKGKRQNVYPVDAKELINSGDFKLVENGAIEAARLAATPLRSGMAAGIPDEHIVAEVSGIEGRVVIAEDEKARDKIVEAGANDGDVPPAKGTASLSAEEAAQAKEKESAAQPKSDAEKKAGTGAAEKK